MKPLQLAGKKFGRLLVVKRNPDKTRYGNYKWDCVCDCGENITVAAGNLISATTKSCGCLRRDLAIAKYSANLSEQRFGKLIALVKDKEAAGSRWICQCDCGTKKSIDTYKLTSGETRSCGCWKPQAPDLTGEKFGRLTVISRSPKRGSKYAAYWDCLCSCGNKRTVIAGSLRQGVTASCGCLHKERITNFNLTDAERAKKRNGQLRNLVLQRDNTLCCACTRKHKLSALFVHHILPWATYPELRYATENCITLCKTCHDEFHNVYGRHDFDDRDLIDYLT